MYELLKNLNSRKWEKPGIKYKLPKNFNELKDFIRWYLTVGFKELDYINYAIAQSSYVSSTELLALRRQVLTNHCNSKGLMEVMLLFNDLLRNQFNVELKEVRYGTDKNLTLIQSHQLLYKTVLVKAEEDNFLNEISHALPIGFDCKEANACLKDAINNQAINLHHVKTELKSQLKHDPLANKITWMILTFTYDEFKSYIIQDYQKIKSESKQSDFYSIILLGIDDFIRIYPFDFIPQLTEPLNQFSHKKQDSVNEIIKTKCTDYSELVYELNGFAEKITSPKSTDTESEAKIKLNHNLKIIIDDLIDYQRQGILLGDISNIYSFVVNTFELRKEHYESYPDLKNANKELGLEWIEVQHHSFIPTFNKWRDFFISNKKLAGIILAANMNTGYAGSTIGRSSYPDRIPKGKIK